MAGLKATIGFPGLTDAAVSKQVAASYPEALADSDAIRSMISEQQARLPAFYAARSLGQHAPIAHLAAYHSIKGIAASQVAFIPLIIGGAIAVHAVVSTLLGHPNPATIIVALLTFGLGPASAGISAGRADYKDAVARASDREPG